MIKKGLFKNSANCIVALRTLLVFVVIYLLNVDCFSLRVAALVILAIAAALDWLDGFIAKRCGISSKLGGLMDTLGDRITENLLLVFFAYQHIIPVFVPLVFVTRSFVADFIRYLDFRSGFSTFSINTSVWGKVFVASPVSRAVYLLLKIMFFFLAGIVLVIMSLHNSSFDGLLGFLHRILYGGSFVLAGINLLRFFVLAYDSRAVLREEFSK